MYFVTWVIVACVTATMAVDLTRSRHSFGRIPENQLGDVNQFTHGQAMSYQTHGQTQNQDIKRISEQFASQSIDDVDPNSYPRGENIPKDIESFGASAESGNQKNSKAKRVNDIIVVNEESPEEKISTKDKTSVQPNVKADMDYTSSDNDEPPPPPPKDTPVPLADNSSDIESYFNPMGLSRAGSLYSISRVSFSNQISQLTTLTLPQASSLSSGISKLTTAPAAARALSGAAVQIQSWIQKSSEVLNGLDADGDAEWAAAAGREGSAQVEKAAENFEGLIGVYVAAIEALQLRDDITTVPKKELNLVVEQMEKIMRDWKDVKKQLKVVKEQVELAMEFEELWAVVLGDIGEEMDSLDGLMFEMEEKRHTYVWPETSGSGNGVDLAELETIVEGRPPAGGLPKNHRLSFPLIFSSSSPTETSGPNSSRDDSNLMALFARMQPLRASLDFLPMRLSTFHARAEEIFPTACDELKTRNSALEKQWTKLQKDAKELHCELSEDRWVMVFRNAGRQAHSMYVSIERTVDNLLEAIETGAQHSNPGGLAKKIDSYEAKKIHYGQAIHRVLGIIEKGVKDRITINGEILRLIADLRRRWSALQDVMKDMDLGLKDLNLKESQQIRDPMSSNISTPRSVIGSGLDTPKSSPASSVIVTPIAGKNADASAQGLKGNNRRGSFVSSAASRPEKGKRYASMPPGSLGSSNIPRKTPISRSGALAFQANRSASPSSMARNSPITPTPAARNQRSSPVAVDCRPRWTSSGNMNGTTVGHNFKPVSLTTPSPYRKTPSQLPTPRSNPSKSSIPIPSSLSREASTSPKTDSPSLPRPRKASGGQSSLPTRDGKSPPHPTHSPQETSDTSRPKLLNKVSALRAPSKGSSQSMMLNSRDSGEPVKQVDEPSPPTSSKDSRPTTALAAMRRPSKLPQPKARVVSGKTSAMGGKNHNGVKANGDEKERQRWR